MIFKNLYLNIIIRISLIIGSCFLFVFAFHKYHDIIININIIALLILQVVFFIRRLNYMNRSLISFFDSIKYDESSVLISEEFHNQDFLRLSKRFQNVNRQILKLKEQNIQQDLYFKTVTEHATVGLLSFNESGIVKLCNKGFKELLNLDSVTNISQLNYLNQEFENILISLKPSEQKLIKINVNNNIIQLVIRATEFKSKTEKLKLISMQDIKNELDEKELESWQKMTQILRHEIMNSIGPISSTIDTLNEIITDPENNQALDLKDLNNEIIGDIVSGLKIVQERNQGIQNFIDNFRSISKLPKPEFRNVNIKDLYADIELLWKKELENKGIVLSILIENNSDQIYADKTQIEQVLINLIKNSVEALSDINDPKIILKAFRNSQNKLTMQLNDNGIGIPKDIIDEIFFPFFTTKPNGSGIGLSLSQQIIRQHGGNIIVISEDKKGTEFTIKI